MHVFNTTKTFCFASEKWETVWSVLVAVLVLVLVLVLLVLFLLLLLLLLLLLFLPAGFRDSGIPVQVIWGEK